MQPLKLYPWIGSSILECSGHNMHSVLDFLHSPPPLPQIKVVTNLWYFCNLPKPVAQVTFLRHDSNFCDV